MTAPYDPNQPPYPQQPPYGPPAYGAPQQYPPQQPAYAPSQPDPGYGQWQQPVPLSPAPPRRRGKAIAAAATAVVVIGGGVATYAAVSSGDAGGGSATPKAAVQQLVTDLDNSDLVGLLDDLPPSERSAIGKPLQQTFDELKKNDVLKPGADLSKVSGVTVKSAGLTFAPKTITINDHVQIVQLTGGTIAVSADATKAPFTSDFLHAVAPGGVSDSHGTSTIDIAKVVRETGRPLRIATQRAGGQWYPSLLYSIADNLATSNGLHAPGPADRIPAQGGSSADDAVRSFITALLQGNVEQAAEVLDPNSLAVVHDYGKLITSRLHYSAPHVQLGDIQFTDTPISGGTRVTIKSLDAVDGNGGELKLAIDGSCVSATVQQQTRRMCASQILDLVTSGPFGAHFTAAQKRALGDLLSGITKAAGMDVAQVGGQWYLDPIRSYFDIANTLLGGLKGDDGHQLLLLLTH